MALEEWILQARILEWVDIPSSRGSSQSRNENQVSCIAGGFFTAWAAAWKSLLSLWFFSSYQFHSDLLWQFTMLPMFRSGHDYQNSSIKLRFREANVCVLGRFSCVRLFATPCQSPLFMRFSRQEVEWVAMPSSRGSFWPRDRTHVYSVSCMGWRVLFH